MRAEAATLPRALHRIGLTRPNPADPLYGLWTGNSKAVPSPCHHIHGHPSPLGSVSRCASRFLTDRPFLLGGRRGAEGLGAPLAIVPPQPGRGQDRAAHPARGKWEGDRLSFAVADDGTEISSEQLQRLFQRSSQADGTTTLGLVLSFMTLRAQSCVPPRGALSADYGVRRDEPQWTLRVDRRRALDGCAW
jgi:hypothetical protein